MNESQKNETSTNPTSTPDGNSAQKVSIVEKITTGIKKVADKLPSFLFRNDPTPPSCSLACKCGFAIIVAIWLLCLVPKFWEFVIPVLALLAIWQFMSGARNAKELKGASGISILVGLVFAISAFFAPGPRKAVSQDLEKEIAIAQGAVDQMLGDVEKGTSSGKNKSRKIVHISEKNAVKTISGFLDACMKGDYKKAEKYVSVDPESQQTWTVCMTDINNNGDGNFVFRHIEKYEITEIVPSPDEEVSNEFDGVSAGIVSISAMVDGEMKTTSVGISVIQVKGKIGVYPVPIH